MNFFKVCFIIIILWAMNLKYLCLANLPSLYHNKCSAQSDNDVQVLGRLIVKSPDAYGKRHGKAIVKQYLVENSESGVLPLDGHGKIKVPFYQQTLYCVHLLFLVQLFQLYF